MTTKKLFGVVTAALAVAVLAAPMMASAADDYTIVLPSMEYRTGPFAPNGIPFANGFTEYLIMLNERDGGINGVPISVPKCETAYNTKKGVECYQKLKDDALVLSPLSTGITYAVMPKARADGVTIHSMGYGRSSAAYGRVFKWTFNFPATYWDQAAVIVKYIGNRLGGMDKLADQKIALIYLNAAYGREPIPTLKTLSRMYGYDLMLLPIDYPGTEQGATWLKIRRGQPDWIILWGWGLMNQATIQEAVKRHFPMDHMIGNWWSGAEVDVTPAGKGADGYLAATWHSPGKDFPVFEDIKKYVYEQGLNIGEWEDVGNVLYNRGLLQAVYVTEVVRQAMERFDTKHVTQKMFREAMEHFDLTAERLKELGLGGFTYPIHLTCANHGGPRRVAIQQWDAETKTWDRVTGFIETMHDVVDPMMKKDALEYAKTHNIEVRDCFMAAGK